MKASQFLLLSFCAAASANTFSQEETLFASLLKRQEPGTPAYNCHDNCGAAITQSKLPTPCTSPSFLSNYANCLQCSGPDNYNIWRYYGRTLSAAGQSCGLETEPKSGVQEEVGPAVQGEGSASGTGTATGSATIATGGLTSTGVAASVTASASTTGVVSSGVAQSEVSVVPSQSVNATASVTAPAPVEVSTNAAAGLGMNDAGIFGAIFVGALFGL